MTEQRTFMLSTNHSIPKEISAPLLVSTVSNNFNLLRAKTKIGRRFP